jgi:hypothetical protein
MVPLVIIDILRGGGAHAHIFSLKKTKYWQKNIQLYGLVSLNIKYIYRGKTKVNATHIILVAYII